ncbi:leucine-rich repeat transmembrane neuronal protein 3-like [Ruditapes philippinarum]|uniref:leucine-rich repeat transmembrane neuronal protein 3-like n=1 Tax=Ruditapes philippinarum TaxID=129788 RepID=UPI00295AC0E0|nr:leucine-rich repeat transmembrane neuronal protein 3-like [Ruditapes philippinarum]
MRNISYRQIIVVSAFLGLSSSFVLDDNCPESSLPCTCYGNSRNFSYISCTSKSLTNIPNIKQSGYHVNKLYLDFELNEITVIRNNAFITFSSINASEIDLRLDNNKIHSVESNAFTGVANSITSLHLQHNNLTVLPSAFKNLFNLRNLDVLFNPLHSLDASAMSNIGRSLTSFSLDLDHFKEWPQELHYLRVLQTLTVDNIQFPHLAINAFDGFENTLTSLSLKYYRLEKVPNAICHLSHLSELTIVYSYNLQKNMTPIFEPCGKELSSVTSLTLYANDLHTFPNITLFPSLTLLNLNSNRLQNIDITKIPLHSKLATIDLEFNLLERIPDALNRLKSLQSLSFSSNKIMTIKTSDLAGLSSLTFLRVFDNPITYVEPEAFKDNFNLHHLDLG